MIASALAPAHLPLLLMCLGILFNLFLTGVLLDLAGKQGATIIIGASFMLTILLFMNATHFAIAIIGAFVWSLLQSSGMLKSLKTSLVKHAKFTVAGLPAQS